MKNTAHLFITYQRDGEKVVRGPYYTASPDQRSADGGISYEVQDERGEFTHISVPRYHTLSAVITPDGHDIT